MMLKTVPRLPEVEPLVVSEAPTHHLSRLCDTPKIRVLGPQTFILPQGL